MLKMLICFAFSDSNIHIKNKKYKKKTAILAFTYYKNFTFVSD